MRIEVRVQPRSSKEEITKVDKSSYKIYTRKPAVEGKANKEIISLLADYFNTKKNKIRIVSGLKARNKIVEIDL